MRTPSFRNKILILLVACMCLAQLVTMLATLVTTQRTVRRSVNEDLVVAERTFNQVFEQRFAQLLTSVRVLVDDFGFRSALASQDLPTIVSALENHAARADAAVALYLDNNADLAASTLPDTAWTSQPAWRDLQLSLRAGAQVSTVFSLGERQVQAVAVPVMAPARIGWVLMGFHIDDTLAREFRDITGLHISFLDAQRMEMDDFVSTLPPDEEAALLELLRTNPGAANSADGVAAELTLLEDSYLTQQHALSDNGTPVYAILQKSLQQEMQPYVELEGNLVLMFLTVLVVAVLAGIAIGNSIVAPLRRLAGLAERIGSGNYAIEIRHDSSDEIGQLGATLNTMQQEIANREYRIIHQTQHDDLTGLPNRYLVRDRIDQAVTRSQRSGQPFTVVLLDIARFKQVNDTLGHHIGDILLKESANRMLRRQRKSDSVARMGGDDFLLLLENTDLATSMTLVCEELLPLLTSPLQLDDVALSVKFHCGFVEFPTHAENAATLLRRGEIALYEAKSSLSGLGVYTIGRDESHLRELAIISDLERAMLEGQLKLVYQPKLSLADGMIRNAEALIRWNHPTFGFLPPDEFIGVLEQTGNIGKLTNWVIREAARQCRIWQLHGIDIIISVNLSARDLLEPDLLGNLLRTLALYEVDAGHLILEITESAVMRDPQAAKAILLQLREAGFRIAIDDFGTGYSSLAQLKSLPVEELKIDKSFVLNLTACSQDSVIVKSTIDLAHSMQLEVVAEGIETAESLALLQDYGCDLGQGYYIARPLAAADFETWYRNSNGRFLPLTRNAA